jgi:hypothetical protein
MGKNPIENLLTKEKPFFQRFTGGYFGLASVVVFCIMIPISIYLHSITVPIKITQHFVSNLGIGPNGSAIVFSIGLLIQALLLFPFILQISRQLWMKPTEKKAHINNTIVQISFVLAMISIPGLILVAFFSMGPATIIPHAIGAMLFFFGTIIYGGGFWIAIEIQKKAGFWLRLSSILVLIFFVCFQGASVALVFLYPEEFQIFMDNPAGYTLRILGDTADTKLAYIRLFEWLFVLSMVIWSFNLSLFSIVDLKEKNQARVNGS